MGRGDGKTPERITQLIRESVANHGQNATARMIGIPLRSVQKYLEGIAEPTTATLAKLATFYEADEAWLRGKPFVDRSGQFLGDRSRAWCAECGNELQASGEGFEANEEGEIVGDRRLRLWPCEICCKKG